MLIFELILTLLNWRSFLESAGVVLKIGWNLKPNHHWKFSLPRSVKCSVVKTKHKNNNLTVTSMCQFHQHFTHKFLVWISPQSQNVTRKSCRNNVCTKNARKKTLMKLTAGVIFINILRANFSYKSAFVLSPKPKRY